MIKLYNNIRLNTFLWLSTFITTYWLLCMFMTTIFKLYFHFSFVIQGQFIHVHVHVQAAVFNEFTYFLFRPVISIRSV